MASYGLALQTAPTSEPVSLAEAKVQCGVAEDVIYHNERLNRLIEAARIKVEADTGRALINQTWDLTLDCWPWGLEPIYIPKAPLSSVTHVKYYDTSGVEQTLATTVYKVILAREPGEIRLKASQSWTSLYSEPSVVTVRFVAGYGANYQFVPDGLRTAMLLVVHKLFDPDIGDIEDTYRSLIANYSVGDEFHAYAR